MFVLMSFSLILYGSIVKADSKNDALKAYSEYLRSNRIASLDEGFGDWPAYFRSDQVKFAIVYLDNNSVPELFITSLNQRIGYEYDALVFTYRNGRIERYEDFATTVGLGPTLPLTYYKKTGIIKYNGIYGETFYENLTNGKVKGIGVYSNYSGKKKYYIWTTNKYVSKSSFDKYIKNCTKRKKGTKLVFYDNTVENRRKFLKETTSSVVVKPSVTPKISISYNINGGSCNFYSSTTPTNSSVTWSSSNPNVATVVNGEVIAKSAGTAVIKASMRYNGIDYTASKTVVVNNKIEYGNWGAWSAWSRDWVEGSDTREVNTQTVYGYYYYQCPHCGYHSYSWDKCRPTWPGWGGCGNYIGQEYGHQIFNTVSWSSANLKDCGGTGKYYTDSISGGRWYKWDDGSGPWTGYRYRDRSKYVSAVISSIY